MVLKKLSLIKLALALNRPVTHVAEVKECPLLCNKCGSLGHHLGLWWRQNKRLKDIYCSVIYPLSMDLPMQNEFSPVDFDHGKMW